MKKLSTQDEAHDLLQRIKAEIQQYGLLVMNKRPHNAQTLADLNMNSSGLKEIVLGLTSYDYCGGPDEDERYPWKVVALFGKLYKNTELYIKLSVGYDQTPVVCLSFHVAAYPMPYQFK